MNDQNIMVDCLFPGGNILVDSVIGNHIKLYQDLRDTREDWFYWTFRVRGAAGRTLTVEFLKSNVIGVLGPAASLDEGLTWQWLGQECVTGQRFSYTVPIETEEVRFSLGMPYQQDHLKRFLKKYEHHSALKISTLCYSRKGRPVQALYAGRTGGQASRYVLLTCRHHACEMMASYSLEGVLATVLAGSEAGRWLRENVTILAVPFMDIDGVEDGDQGKNRWPWDHVLDYVGASMYPEVRTLRQLVPDWCDNRLDVALDLHCPWIRGHNNEFIYFVGGPEEKHWRELGFFSQILEENCRGPLPFESKNNLPFGEDWNTPIEGGRKSKDEWARETFPGLRIGNCLEIPYANASGVEVNADSARAFGYDLANALYLYLSGL